MAAGASAHHESQRSLLEAAEYERLARAAREQATRYALASRTEAQVAGRLTALEALGWRVLPDRRWAGSKRANVDLLMVGPGGVVVGDVKAWRSLEVRGGSVFCEDDCRDDEMTKLLGLTQTVHDALAPLGLTGQAVHPVLIFSGRRLHEHTHGVDLVGESNAAAWVGRLRHRLDPETITQISEVLEAEFPAYDVSEPTRPKLPKRRVVMPRMATPQPEALIDVDELTQSLLDAALEGPIESWMTFLHPSQLKLVNTSWSGPARVRGPAGTGKTVVGLHRAAYLAERSPHPVLFVTFVRTLPVVLDGLCERLSPKARGNIDFTGLHRLALRLLDEAGVRIRIDGRRIETAYAQAWLAVARHGVLARLDERPRYWKEELDYVIKGRGLTDFAEYAELNRLGRRTPLRTEHREAMWELYVEYERRRGLLGIHDFNDALILARDLVRDGEVVPAYSSVIVDEVQDLPLVGLQLLHAIAGDGPDRLLLIGDGQQAVYPGGFTLGEAGISVSGRATVLRDNYRNTTTILEAAARVVGGDTFDDLEGTPMAAEGCGAASRAGVPPLVVRAGDRVSLDTALTRQILDTRERLGTRLGDMAVLVLTRADLEHYVRVLRHAGIACADLKDYDGVSVDSLKVGTFKRAKGLEFAFVLMPGLREGALEAWRSESDDAFRERAERTRRELYVGMTRARDGLWLGYVAER